MDELQDLLSLQFTQQVTRTNLSEVSWSSTWPIFKNDLLPCQSVVENVLLTFLLFNTGDAFLPLAYPPAYHQPFFGGGETASLPNHSERQQGKTVNLQELV